jgi:hypothetical protein
MGGVQVFYKLSFLLYKKRGRSMEMIMARMKLVDIM